MYNTKPHDLSPYAQAGRLLDDATRELMGYRLRPEEAADLLTRIGHLKAIIQTSET